MREVCHIPIFKCISDVRVQSAPPILSAVSLFSTMVLQCFLSFLGGFGVVVGKSRWQWGKVVFQLAAFVCAILLDGTVLVSFGNQKWKAEIQGGVKSLSCNWTSCFYILRHKKILPCSWERIWWGNWVVTGPKKRKQYQVLLSLRLLIEHICPGQE